MRCRAVFGRQVTEQCGSTLTVVGINHERWESAESENPPTTHREQRIVPHPLKSHHCQGFHLAFGFVTPWNTESINRPSHHVDYCDLPFTLKFLMRVFRVSRACENGELTVVLGFFSCIEIVFLTQQIVCSRSSKMKRVIGLLLTKPT